MAAFSRVGRALALLRKEKGLTQSDLAKMMKIGHKSNASSIETGHPTSDSIDRYLDALGLTAHDLARALDEANGRATAKGGGPDEAVALLSDPEFLLAQFPDTDSAGRAAVQRAAMQRQNAARALDLAVAEARRPKRP